MDNFARVIRRALHQQWTVAGILLSSLMIALLWGANIGTLYPFVQVVLEGKSMTEWISGELEDSRTRIAELEAELERHERPTAQHATQSDAPGDESDAAWARNQTVQALKAERRALAWYERARPWIQRTPASPFATLLMVVAVLIVGTVIKGFLLVINHLLVERLAQVCTFGLRRDFYHCCLSMDHSAFSHDKSSGLMSRLTHDIAQLGQGLSTLFGKSIREPFKMLACLAGAWFICPRLLLLTMVVSPIAFLLIRQLSRSIKRASRRALEEVTNLYGVIGDTFHGMEAVKAYTMEPYERARFHQISKQFLRRAMRIVGYNSLIRPTTEILGIVVISMGIVAGGYLVLNMETHLGWIKIADRPLDRGALMTFFAMLIGISDPARKLADVFTSLNRAAAAADRVYEVVDREPTIVDPESPLPPPAELRSLELEDVVFGYEPQQTVLNGVSLSIRPGERIAIVGPNGCGKSTLTNLLVRFYDPQAGRVLINGNDLRDFRVRDVRRLFAIVTQKTVLFDDTVENNIRYGNRFADPAAVREAAKRAFADVFIESQLEEGYATRVGEKGSRLSGGQRQRLALARAFLANPPILILDEATSQIDVESEELIHRALKEFSKDRTTLMITHRQSTLQLADRIVVMNEGQILDCGPHQQLLARCEFYRRLFQVGLRESA